MRGCPRGCPRGVRGAHGARGRPRALSAVEMHMTLSRIEDKPSSRTQTDRLRLPTC